MNKILVSACLMGFKVRYNGSEKARMNAQLARWQQEQRLVIHCPELAAGMPVPRPPAEIMSADGKDVMRGQARISENTGQDVTEQYQLAAWLALRAAQASGCSAALLTDGSPTCGSEFIYDGSFRGIHKAGRGLLRRCSLRMGSPCSQRSKSTNSLPGLRREKAKNKPA